MKNVTFIIAALFIFKFSGSQTIQWTKQLGTNYNDDKPFTLSDSLNNVWLIYFEGNGNRVTHIIKYDQNGEEILHNKLYDIYILHAQYLENGHICFMGSTFYNSIVIGYQLLTIPQDSTYIMSVMDLDGNYLHSSVLPFSDGNYDINYNWNDFKFDINENIYVAGTRHEHIMLPESDHLRKNFNWSLFYKINSNGEIINSKITGTNAFGQNVQPVSNGVYYSGRISNNYKTLFIDLNNDTIWSSAFEAKMVKNFSNDIFFLGALHGTESFGNTTLTYTQNSFFIACKDANHNFKWAHLISKGDWNNNSDMYYDEYSKNFYFSSLIFDTLKIDSMIFPLHGMNICLTSLDSTGKFSWMKAFEINDSLYYSFSQSVIVDKHNNCYFTNAFRGSMNIENIYSSLGQSDIIFTKINDAPSFITDHPDTIITNAEIPFTNPCDQAINFTLPELSDFTNAELYDVNGKILRSANLKSKLFI